MILFTRALYSTLFVLSIMYVAALYEVAETGYLVRWCVLVMLSRGMHLSGANEQQLLHLEHAG